MIATILARMATMGLPRGVARAILFVGLAVAVCIIVWLLWTRFLAGERREAVQLDRDKFNAVVEREARSRDAIVAERRRTDDATLANDTKELERVTTDETSSVADRRRAFYDRVRRQQAEAGLR